ncbi:MAG: hypothetical protein OJF47_001873 [Nitrospira sp.]|jgi:hypothetical protein|nr:MAG: hypothetical protein OJF47_001873 [Nitrospira sp.]
MQLLKDRSAVMTLLIFLAGCAVLWGTGTINTRHLIDNIVAGYFLVWGLYAFLSSLPKKEVRARFVLMTVACVLVLGAAEIPAILSLVNYQVLLGGPERGLWDRPGYVRDPDLRYRHVPHHRERGLYVRGNLGEGLCLPPNPPKEFDLRYDHNGFRNDEDMDRADVVVIGDSYVEGAMLPSSDLLTAALAERLGTVVANLGVNGYGPEQELVVLKRYALSLQPKAIVWVFFEGNDLSQVHSEEDETEDSFSDTGAPQDDYWIRSLTRNLLFAAKKVIQGCVPNRTLFQFRGEFQEADGQRTELFFVEEPWPARRQGHDPLERVRTILTEAYELTRLRGIQFVVAYAPTSYRVHHGLKNFEPSTPQMKKLPVSSLLDEFEQMLESISPDIEFVDLTLPLREAAAAGILTYLSDDTHWTSDGQRIAGQALHQHLTATASRESGNRYVSEQGLPKRKGSSLQRL